MSEIQKIDWKEREEEKLSDSLSRQTLSGEKATMARLFAKRGASIARHSHVSEEYLWVVSGALEYRFDDGTKVSVHANEGLVVPPNVSHAIEVLRKTVAVYFFSPARDDWARGEDQYLRA